MTTMAKETETRMAAKRMAVGFEVIDGYLLSGHPPKGEVVAAVLADRVDSAAAAPFYRALEAVGARAADEAFLALRLILAGRPPDDDAVRRLRALAAVARASSSGDVTAFDAVFKRERVHLGSLAEAPVASPADRAAVGQAAAKSYAAELESVPSVERNAGDDALR